MHHTIKPAGVICSAHEKEGRPPSLRVDWTDAAGGPSVTEWVPLFTASSWGRKRAAWWWFDHVGGDLPGSIGEAVERGNAMPLPLWIVYSTFGRWPRVISSSLPSGRLSRRGP